MVYFTHQLPPELEFATDKLWDGNRMMLPDELPYEVARAVKNFKVHPNRGVEIEMHGKLRALDLLTKIHGLLEQHPEKAAKRGGPIQPKATVVPTEELLTDEQRRERMLEIALLLKSIERAESIGK